MFRSDDRSASGVALAATLVLLLAVGAVWAAVFVDYRQGGEDAVKAGSSAPTPSTGARVGPEDDKDAQVKGATELIANTDSDDWQIREDPESVYTTSGEVTPNPADALQDVPEYYDDHCQIRSGDSKVDTICVYGKKDGEKTIAMLGDSKMGQWFPAVASIADSEGWRLELYLKSECSFTYDGKDPDCNEFGKNVIDHVESEGAPDIALVSQGSASSPDLRTGMADAVEDLRAQGAEVIIVADSPMPAMSKVYACVEEHPEDYSACAFAAEKDNGREGRGTEALKPTAEETKAPFVDLNEWICPPGKECPPVIGDTLIYHSGSHVTASYIRTLTPMLYRELAAQDLTSRDSAEITTDDVP